MPTEPSNVNTVTTVLASIGAVLGFINTCNALERQRVLLRITPSYFVLQGGELHVAIEVLNLSPFPVTISEIGFEVKGGNKCIHTGKLTNGKLLPSRLESRDEITAIFPCSLIPVKHIQKAFGRTICGHKFVGDSPALKEIRAGKTPPGAVTKR